MMCLSPSASSGKPARLLIGELAACAPAVPSMVWCSAVLETGSTSPSSLLPRSGDRFKRERGIGGKFVAGEVEWHNRGGA